ALAPDGRAGGFDPDDDLGELPGTTGLLLVRVGNVFDLAFDRLAVGDLRLADIGFDMEFALHPVDEDVQMQFTHTGDDGLTGFIVGVYLECGIFFHETLNSHTEFLLVALGFGFDGHFDDRLGERHGFQHDRRGGIGQRFAGGGVFQAHHGHDLPGSHRCDLFAFIGVHLVDLADALAVTLRDVENLRAGFKTTGVHADVGQFTQVRVGGDLEGQRGKRRIFGGLPVVFDRGVFGVVARDRSDVQRGRQVADDRIQQRLDALVLERGAAHDRHELGPDRGAANGAFHLLNADIGAVQIQFGEFVVGVGQLLDHGFACFGGTVGQFGGDLFDFVVFADGDVAAPRQGAHAHQIDDTLKIRFGAHGDLDHQRVSTQALADRGDGKVKIGAVALHLIDET